MTGSDISPEGKAVSSSIKNWKRNQVKNVEQLYTILGQMKFYKEKFPNIKEIKDKSKTEKDFLNNVVPPLVKFFKEVISLINEVINTISENRKAFKYLFVQEGSETVAMKDKTKINVIDTAISGLTNRKKNLQQFIIGIEYAKDNIQLSKEGEFKFIKDIKIYPPIFDFGVRAWDGIEGEWIDMREPEEENKYIELEKITLPRSPPAPFYGNKITDTNKGKITLKAN
jgi:hypothetical protein